MPLEASLGHAQCELDILYLIDANVEAVLEAPELHHEESVLFVHKASVWFQELEYGYWFIKVRC